MTRLGRMNADEVERILRKYNFEGIKILKLSYLTIKGEIYPPEHCLTS